MRFILSPSVQAGLLAFLLAPLASQAWEFPRTDSESQETFRRIESDYNSNPIWKNASLNKYRDGKISDYVSSSDAFKAQGEPLTADEIAKLPEGKFVSWTVFNRAITGLRKILETFPTLDIRSDTITIVDFDQPTESRRLLVLDLASERVVFQTWVHHGRNSDKNKDRIPELFSNADGSYKSSIGFYLTEKSAYAGKWGHSVRLHGLDRGLNSNIHSRAIVMHPWMPFHARRLAERDPKQVSLGCLALPYYESGKFIGMADEPIAHLVVDHLKGRSVIFVNTSHLDLTKVSGYLSGNLSAATAKATLAQVESQEGRAALIDEALAYPEDDRSY